MDSAQAVLVPGEIKWLENMMEYISMARVVLVPGKIKWLENKAMTL